MQRTIADVGLRMLLAAALVASGAIHLRLWFDGYDHVRTIGDLFLLQAAACGLLAVLVLVARHRRLWIGLGGLLALATAGGLLAAATIGILGFHDALSAPLAGASLAVETAAAGAALAWLGTSAGRRISA